MTPSIRVAAFALLLAAAAPAAFAQTAPEATPFQTTTLDLSASGEVKAVPDMATITVGVTSDGATPSDALRANSASMAQLLAALKAHGIEARDIQTSNLNLSPRYIYKPNESPTPNGFEASNQVTVTVRDLAKLGDDMDAVVAAGATNIASLSFGLKNPGAARDAARFAAVKDLQDKAAIYANASGYHIRRLVNLSEGTATYVQPMMRAQARPGAGFQGVPVSEGEMTVRIDITGEFELTH